MRELEALRHRRVPRRGKIRKSSTPTPTIRIYPG
jgi:hypothetical protein